MKKRDQYAEISLFSRAIVRAKHFDASQRQLKIVRKFDSSANLVMK